MPFQPGRTKTGGRTEGTPNKATNDLLNKCQEAGIDPWKEILSIAADRGHPDRFNALKEILPYLYPKRKAIEVTQDNPSQELSRLSPQQLSEKVSKALDVLGLTRGVPPKQLTKLT
jgi:hypothetical protein